MVEVEFQGQCLQFEQGQWRGDPILARYLNRATSHLLDRELTDCGCGASDAERAIVEATMAHVGGNVLPVTYDPKTRL